MGGSFFSLRKLIDNSPKAKSKLEFRLLLYKVRKGGAGCLASVQAYRLVDDHKLKWAI